MYKLAIIEDHHLIRTGLESFFERCCDFEVVFMGEGFGNGETKEIVDCKPDLAIIDLSLAHGSSLPSVVELMSKLPDLKILMLTAHTAMRSVNKMAAANVSGIADKSIDPKALCSLLMRMMSGHKVYYPEDLIYKISDDPKPLRVDELTKKEYEVLSLIGGGLTPVEIAARFRISRRTVEMHIGSLIKKLKVANRTELQKLANDEGIGV